MNGPKKLQENSQSAASHHNTKDQHHDYAHNTFRMSETRQGVFFETQNYLKFKSPDPNPASTDTSRDKKTSQKYKQGALSH